MQTTSKRLREKSRKRLWTTTKPERVTGDVSILIVTVALAVFGLFAVYSASGYTAKAQYGDEWYFVKKQAIGLVFGLVAMCLCARLDYRVLSGKKIRYVALIAPIILLALVFVPGLGKSNYGATRWIGIGGFTLQPSELAKYGFVVFASAYAAERMEKMRTFTGAFPVLIAGGCICGLIILEPNMSVTMCVGIIMLGMLFLSGLKMKYFLMIFLPALCIVPVMIILEPYRLSRLSAFLDPWENPKGEGYQLIQSLYALGNGGWFGTGFLKSRQKFRFLPFAESDFILAIIGEEFGAFGIIVLFCVTAYLTYRGIRVARESEDFFSFLLASGITMVYGVQSVLNALVVSGSIPPTGLPLPLISAGNTSLIITMSSMGVLYAVSKRTAMLRKSTKTGLYTYNKA